MSIFASALRAAYKLSGAKKAFGLPEAEIRKVIDRQNRSRGVFTPTDRKAYYETITVNGFPCLIVRGDPKPSARAILYFFGGGMVIGPDKGDLPVMRKLMQATGCDGVMIARGALGDPWLFERVNAAIEGLPAPKAPNLQARMNALRRQVEEMVEQKGEFVAMPQARAQTMHYMKGLKGAAALRRYCCTLTHLEDLDELIDAVFEEQRKAGIDPDDVREVPFP